MVGVFRGPIAAVLVLAVSSGVAKSAGGQTVRLLVGPRAGDTLHMRMDQAVEVVARQRVHGADTAVTTATNVAVFTRTVVQHGDSAGTTVLSIIDSIRVKTTGAAPGWVRRARRQLEGQRLPMRVAPDGQMTVLDDESDQHPDLRRVFARVPATLPDRAVSVGGSWVREMPIPVRGQVGGPAVAILRATFRLDSLSPGGETAYISMHGTLAHDTTAERAERHAMTGSVSGTILLDRRRGWIADARTTITVTSVMMPPPEIRAEPVRVRMRVTQWLRETIPLPAAAIDER